MSGAPPTKKAKTDDAGPKFKMSVNSDKVINGQMAASYGADILRKVIAAKGSANVILATGASQFEMLEALVKCEGIDWTKVSLMHLDEYVGMDNTHGASFAKYLQERFVDKLPAGNKPKSFDFVSGLGDPRAECTRLGKLAVEKGEWDLSFIGIGENGHLAFNDPPCNVTTTDPYIVVNLDEACRKQQMGEGWFATFDDCPKQAISMSMQQILKAKHIVCTVPDSRKAQAVFDGATMDVSPTCPATYLQTHPSCVVFCDIHAAAKVLSA